MIISLIVAMDEMRGIGVNGGLPWHIPADLKRFKSLTMGHHLIMGRKTYESIGRPLPGRTMIIITRNQDFQAEDCLTAHSLETALEMARTGQEEEVFVIGGGEIFAQAIERADRIYLTLVHGHTPADVYFPKYPLDQWVEVDAEFHAPDEHNPYSHSFRILSRRNAIK